MKSLDFPPYLAREKLLAGLSSDPFGIIGTRQNILEFSYILSLSLSATSRRMERAGSVSKIVI
jgi:hypothetical protein